MAGNAAWYSSASDGSSYRPIVGGVTAGEPAVQPDDVLHVGDGDEHLPERADPADGRGVPGLFLIRAGGPVDGRIRRRDRQRDRRDRRRPRSRPTSSPVTATSSCHRPTSRASASAFAQETPTGSGAFVSGPNGADGAGSAQLTVDTTGGEALANGLFAGTRFDRLHVPVVQDVREGRRERTRRRCSSTPTTTAPTEVPRSRVGPCSSRAKPGSRR